MKTIFMILLVTVFFSCKQDQRSIVTSENKLKEKTKALPDSLNKYIYVDQSKKYYIKKSEIRELAFEAIKENNKGKYNETKIFLTKHPDFIEEIFYSINMAYQNRCPNAYFDIAAMLKLTLDPSDTSSAYYYFYLYNLAKAHESGIKIYSLDKLKDKKGKIKSSDYFLKKFGEANNESTKK